MNGLGTYIVTFYVFEVELLGNMVGNGSLSAACRTIDYEDMTFRAGHSADQSRKCR